MRGKTIAKYFVLLNGINDFAYFGFLTIQFLLLEPLIRRLLQTDQTALSVGLTITIITSQLLWQILAEGPTGALADLYGRAWAVAASFWCRMVAIVLVIWCVSVKLNFESDTSALIMIVAVLILAQILMATGEACLEGSIEAWLRDECELADPNNHEEITGKAFDYSAIIQNICILVSVSTCLALFDESLKRGISLAIAAACLCLIGALFSHWLSRQEKYRRNSTKNARSAKASLWHIRSAVRGVILKIHDSFRMIVHAEASLRRLIAILILPFPCWIMLSWFFTAFADSGGASRIGLATDALWLGAILGVTRVFGAWTGKKLTSQSDERHLRLVFEKAVFLNVFFLLGAALLLVLNNFGVSVFFPSIGTILFLTAIGLAKGSEEVVKLSKNKILALTLPDADIRATTLSLVSVAQNAVGFTAISLSGILAFMVANDSWQAIIIFAVCALLGITGWVIYHKVSPMPMLQTKVIEK